jgi:hypothetical protein
MALRCLSIVLALSIVIVSGCHKSSNYQPTCGSPVAAPAPCCPGQAPLPAPPPPGALPPAR